MDSNYEDEVTGQLMKELYDKMQWNKKLDKQDSPSSIGTRTRVELNQKKAMSIKSKVKGAARR